MSTVGYCQFPQTQKHIFYLQRHLLLKFYNKRMNCRRPEVLSSDWLYFYEHVNSKKHHLKTFLFLMHIN